MSSHDVILEARIQDIRPSIWRVVRVPGRRTLKHLHQLLQMLFGWQDYHLHEFEIEDERFGDPGSDEECEADETGVKLAELRKNTVFYYRYDFGDGWLVKLRVQDLVSSEEAVTGPRLLDGRRAGPPEDCGGTEGYRTLLAALRNPRDEEERSLKAWAGRWEPERFDLKTVQAALDRRFRVRRTAPRQDSPGAEVWLQPSPDQLEALKRATGSPPLEGYHLASLKPRELMLAVLLSEGPKTLEELAARLDQAGVRLPHGLTSLRRCWRGASMIRQRLDGRLEVVPEDPELWYPLAKMRENLDRKYPEIDRRRRIQQSSARNPKEVPPESGPVSWEELVESTQSGYRLSQSIRRWIMLCLEARGGRRAEAELVEDLGQLGLRPNAQNLIKSLAGKNLPVGREPDGNWWVDSSRAEVKSTREAFRKWWAPRKNQREQRARMSGSAADWKRRREEEERAHRRWFSAASRAILRVFRHGSSAAGAMLHLVMTPEGEAARLERFLPEERESLCERIRGTHILLGLDPRGELERLDLPVASQYFLDLSPPVKTRMVGGRRRPCPAEEILRVTVPEYPLGLAQELEAQARSGRWESIVEALAGELTALHSWYRYGVTHGYVLDRDEEWTHLARVFWNVGLEPDLSDCLTCAAERSRPIAIQRFADRHLRLFRPGGAPEDERVYGTWEGERSPHVVPLPEIRAFQFLWEGPLPDKWISSLVLRRPAG